METLWPLRMRLDREPLVRCTRDLLSNPPALYPRGSFWGRGGKPSVQAKHTWSRYKCFIVSTKAWIEITSLPRGSIPIYELHSWTKSVKNFALSYSQDTHPANLAPWWPLPPPLPGKCCLVGSKNVLATLQHCCFWAWRGKYLEWTGAVEGSILKLVI